VTPDAIFDGLNQDQQRAVRAVRGPVCILAGAGTGKTTTITRRIANQIATGTFEPSQILAVTFTDRAAAEMRSRLSHLGVHGVGSVEVRTFHAAALSQLGRYGAAPGQVLSSKAVALRQIANGLPRPYRFRPAGDLATEVEWAKNRRIAPGSYLGGLGDHEPPIPADLMAGVYRRYEQGKEHRGLIDFEDLLELTIRLFDIDPTARERFRDRIRAITVDEYQDANLLQQTVLERWLSGRDELCVVGDDYQSIYGFTGASPDHLVTMPERYAGTTVIRLEENHRSSPEVLATANRLVPRLGGIGKVLRAVRPPGPEPELRGFQSVDAETDHVVEAIQRLHRADGVPLEETAVLIRVNSRTEDYEEALSRARIPFQVRGGSFLSRQAAKAVLRRLRQPVGADVAAAVHAAALAEGMTATSEMEGLGEQEMVRQADLARLVRMADEFDTAGGGGIEAFVADLRRRFEAESVGRGVNILTYHRAKGLEFDAVFLPRLQEGELPFRRARSDSDLAEERRLLYVGITRARRHLVLTWTADGRSKPSRFVAELRPQRAAADQLANVDRRVVAAPGSRVPAGASAAHRAKSLDAEATRTFEALRAWRLDRAREDAVPPYVVFHDSTLVEIATRRPTTRTGLASIGGVGPTKLDRYAGQVLAVIERLAAE
jgi:DNA helicase-2/ATP-dependent DNA helicase PcrA